MSQPPLIEARNISRRVPSGDSLLTLLDDISLTIPAATAVAITGSSGSGKSTLLGLLAGLDLADSGSIRLFGQPLETLDEDARARLRAGQVGFVFQSFQLLPGLTALENVRVPLELSGQQRDLDTLAKEALAQVGLAHRLHHQPGQLSGGEQQRVAIARAFVTRPRLLFADEPTGNLDQHTGAHIEALLFDLRRELDTTLVLVTHDEQLASRCDSRLQLQNGRLVN